MYSFAEIEVFPRLHLSLLDLSDRGYRRNGGLGFALAEPLTKLVFRKSTVTSVAKLSAIGYSYSEEQELLHRIESARKNHDLRQAICLESVTPILRHSGFGSGTAISLACMEATFLLNNRPIQQHDLQALSGRGGVSGVGINTYFNGGVVCDIGRRADAGPFLPSDAIEAPPEMPVTLIASAMPSWDIGILTPRTMRPRTMAEERELFSSNCPLSMQDVCSTIYHAVFGAIGAILASDLPTFCSAVTALQQGAWKRAEIAQYGKGMQAIIEQLQQLGCDAVGMSSVGPTLFFLAEDFESVFPSVKEECSGHLVFRTRPRNSGREVVLG